MNNLVAFFIGTPIALSLMFTAGQASAPVHMDVPRPLEPMGPVEPDIYSLTNRQIVEKLGRERFGSDQLELLIDLVQRESGFRNKAQNPESTAYGMFQFLDATWGKYGYEKTDDPVIQTQAGLDYIEQRYGSVWNAIEFHDSRGWY